MSQCVEIIEANEMLEGSLWIAVKAAQYSLTFNSNSKAISIRVKRVLVINP